MDRQPRNKGHISSSPRVENGLVSCFLFGQAYGVQMQSRADIDVPSRACLQVDLNDRSLSSSWHAGNTFCTALYDALTLLLYCDWVYAMSTGTLYLVSRAREKGRECFRTPRTPTREKSLADLVSRELYIRRPRAPEYQPSTHCGT